MKKTWIVACTLLFVSAVAFAEPAPSQPPLSSAALAAILGQPAAPGACAARQGGAVFAANRQRAVQTKSYCSATATCESGTVFCDSTVNGATCTGVNRNCAVGERGHVTCNGATTQCSTTCSFCEQCAASGDCVACCRCNGGTALSCSNCCNCDATGDCFSCCRCNGGTLFQCNQECNPF